MTRPADPPLCPTCEADGRKTRLHCGACWMHGTPLCRALARAEVAEQERDHLKAELERLKDRAERAVDRLHNS